MLKANGCACGLRLEAGGRTAATEGGGAAVGGCIGVGGSAEGAVTPAVLSGAAAWMPRPPLPPRPPRPPRAQAAAGITPPPPRLAAVEGSVAPCCIIVAKFAASAEAFASSSRSSSRFLQLSARRARSSGVAGAKEAGECNAGSGAVRVSRPGCDGGGAGARAGGGSARNAPAHDGPAEAEDCGRGGGEAAAKTTRRKATARRALLLLHRQSTHRHHHHHHPHPAYESIHPSPSVPSSRVS